MDTIGLDLHKRESQLCIGHDDGTMEERRIGAMRERAWRHVVLVRIAQITIAEHDTPTHHQKTRRTEFGCSPTAHADAHARYHNRELLISQIDRARLRAPPDQLGMRIPARILRTRQRQDFRLQRRFDGAESQRDQRLDHREHDWGGQGPIVQRDRLLHGRGLPVLSRLLSYSWHGWCLREQEWRSVTGFTRFYRGTT